MNTNSCPISEEIRTEKITPGKLYRPVDEMSWRVGDILFVTGINKKNYQVEYYFLDEPDHMCSTPMIMARQDWEEICYTK